ncbi:hypothetical protein ACTOWA_00345 [Herbaspirillum seropedicae]|uniref:hypothetical protein n=1 Tax=Herbaspirillum seropedicae TaxID=964 RepID=UPI00285D2510|nr:hypothetical protein [Herbaspirillum seropedicae]MDR6397961.1 photosystem II stability/assembly factor-like uncharacterized protein [Herbaspirillum seropedicae]
MKLKVMLDAASFVAGAASAVLWLISARALVKSDRADGTYWDGKIVSHGNDLLESLHKQSKYNAWAAGTAAISAGLATITRFLPED